MDSAKFIRKKSVLAAWLVIPLLLALTAEFGSGAFLEYRQTAFELAGMLEHLIPRMAAEVRHFDEFIADYLVNTTGGPSVEDVHLARCNEAAALAGFTITSMSVTQEAVNPEMGVGRIHINLRGTGTGREIANFFKHLKNKDRLIYEEQVRLARAADSEEELDLEAVLGKVYSRRDKGGRP